MVEYDKFDTDPDGIERRLERMGMIDIETNEMLGGPGVVVEWRIPGPTPKEQMPPLAEMRQLRSVAQYTDDGEFTKFALRYPTIDTGLKMKEHTYESAEIKQGYRERFLEAVSLPDWFDERGLTLRGGGSIKNIWYTPHLIWRSAESAHGGTDTDNALRFLKNSVEDYKDEFRGELL